ncbi:MAG: hypothetical protein ABIN05_07870 [candidate division WOR-3 bacterium]
MKKWFCDGCQKQHSWQTSRFITSSNKKFCLKEFVKYLEKENKTLIIKENYNDV